jgi:hypothetical protein
MLEDDTAFNAAYHALTTFERSLTVRQVFQIPPVRVRFQKTQLLARQAARVIEAFGAGSKKELQRELESSREVGLGGRDRAEAGWIAV